MSSVKEAISSFVLKKAFMMQLEEFDRSLLGGNGKVVLGVLGAVYGARLVWRWMNTRAKKARLNRLRRQKQEERQKALGKMEQQITRSKMTAEEADDITSLSITELLQQIKSGQLTVAKALTAYQIKALEVHHRTNCIIEPILEAEEWAQELDRSTNRGPLHGLPVSLKECIGVKGYDVTVGCSIWIDQPFDDDSVVVKILKQQGAIPFVRTNLPQTMLSFESTNPIFGPTCNPHDIKRSAGGSSGGEAALIAGGGSLCGIGSDVGGSIRNPGAMCGVPGFKPTALRVSKKGGRGILVGKNILSAYGPLARDVESLVLMMKSLLIPEMFNLDPVLPFTPFRDEEFNDKRKLRIGYSFYDGSFEPIPAASRAVEVAKGLLESAGHQLVPWEEQTNKVIPLWAIGMTADGGKEMWEILKYDAVDDAVKNLKTATSLPVWIRKLVAFLLKYHRPELSHSLRVSCGCDNVTELWEAIKELKSVQNTIIENWQRNKLDAIICPAFGCVAWRHGVIQHMSGPGSYTAAFNGLDFPGGCVPVTKVTEKDEAAMANYPTKTKPGETHRILKKDMKGTVGLPVSVQIVTLPWQDELCLRVMSDLEKAVKSRDGAK